MQGSPGTPKSTETELAHSRNLLQVVCARYAAIGGLIVGYNVALLTVSYMLVRPPFSNLINIFGVVCGVGFLWASRRMRRSGINGS